MQKRQYPYRALGERLQSFRKKLLETIPEVSGAVELESEKIIAFERGEARPSEDVLDLLISHFGIREDEADELWDLAGYNKTASHTDDLSPMPALVVFPVDNRIVYTDTANISINNFGVVMNFMQNGPGGQPVAVSRVGMSLEHAKSVLEVLERTICQAETPKTPRALPKPSDKRATDDSAGS